MIVVDGMSLENWLSMLASWSDLSMILKQYAVLPCSTVTPVSRQSIFQKVAD